MFLAGNLVLNLIVLLEIHPLQYAMRHFRQGCSSYGLSPPNIIREATRDPSHHLPDAHCGLVAYERVAGGPPTQCVDNDSE